MTKTPAELIRYMVQHTAAAPENAEIAEPGTEGHAKPWEPWSAPVMLLAGEAPVFAGSSPWLYLACRCGWWLGYAPQYDPIELAKVAVAHGENCKLKPDPEPITDVPMVCTLCRRPVVRTTGITPAGWKHASPLDSGRCIHVHGRIAPAAMVAAGNEKVPR